MRERNIAAPSPSCAVLVRYLDRIPTTALVRGNRAAWRCGCAGQRSLEGESGEVRGPTPETIVTCPECGRAFFVIPSGHSRSRPIEVVELSRFHW